MIAVIALGSFIERIPFWAIFNILGSLFYGREALSARFGATAAAGLALHFFAAGLVGGLFGALVGEFRKPLRVLLWGVLTGLLVYYASRALLWRQLGVLGELYASPGFTILAHAVYGAIPGTYPRELRSLRPHLLVSPDPASASFVPTPNPDGTDLK